MGNKRDIVNYNAFEHTRVVNTLLEQTDLKKYNLFRHFNSKGKSVVDIGCGDGIVSRWAVDKGASYVLGVDSKKEMIDIAREKNKGYENKISYKRGFIEEEKGEENFDVAVLSYLLNNAKNLEQLVEQCKGVYSFLKKGGKAIVYNNNPFDTKGGDFSKYGFRKEIEGLKEGDKVIFDYDTMEDDIINYYISPENHEKAFSKTGFSKFEWMPLKLNPDSDKKFWKDYFERENLPVIGMVAVK